MSDAQAGHEKTLTGLLPGLAGANLIYGMGMFESGCTMDYGQLVLDNEFVAMMKFALNGIPVRDDTIVLDIIKEVGQFKDFISHQHTFDNMRKVLSLPKFIDRRMREPWVEHGAKTAYDKAWEEAVDILKTHKPKPLPDDVQKTIRNIVEDTEKEMGIEPS